MTPNLLRHIPDCKNAFDFCEFFGPIKPVTLDQYRSDLKLFSAWLHDHNHADSLPLSPETVKHYLEALAEQGRKANTIKRRKAAIGWLHEINQYHDQNPVYHVSLKGFFKRIQKYRSIKGLSNRPDQKEPLTADVIRKMTKLCSKKTVIGLRNRALLLVGFSSALRRSEVCQLQWSDIQIHDQQTMTIVIRHSKTDKFSEGRSITISKGTKYHCPIQALLAWQQVSGLVSGYIFQPVNKLGSNQPIHSRTYANLIKDCCEKLGLNPEKYSGHSTRRGMLVTASNQGADLHTLKSHARHQNSKMTEHYIGDAISQRNNPTNNLYRYKAT